MDLAVSRPVPTGTLFRDGMITIVVLVLVFLAFDDITTDNASTFVPEYSILVVCAGWLIRVIARLFNSGRYGLGTVSAVALLVGMWAGRTMVSGIVPGFWTKYIVLSVVYVWFWALAVTLLWLGRRRSRLVHRASA